MDSIIAFLLGGILSPLILKTIEGFSNKKEARWKLKYETCLEALKIVDAYISHVPFDGTDNDKTVKQSFSVTKAREVFNKLILVCDNVTLPKEFFDKFFGKNGKIDADLTDLRNAIRKELGFGNELDLNREASYIFWLNGAEDEVK